MTIVLPERPAVPDHDQVLRAHGYHLLRVKRIVQETADTRSFVLDVPEELEETFRYRPGQFCTFRVHIGDDEHLRSYSMSSAPETDADLTVTVKRVAGGLVSNWLLDNVSEGDVLETTKPAGVFCVQDDERPVVAFCGGSGVTPVMSITKSLLASTQRPVRMLYANRARPGDLPRRAERAGRPAARPARRASSPRRRRRVSRRRRDRRVHRRHRSTPTSTSAVPGPSWTWSRRHCSRQGSTPTASSSSAS